MYAADGASIILMLRAVPRLPIKHLDFNANREYGTPAPDEQQSCDERAELRFTVGIAQHYSKDSACCTSRRSHVGSWKSRLRRLIPSGTLDALGIIGGNSFSVNALQERQRPYIESESSPDLQLHREENVF
jgi:hypothetical protein